MIEAKLSPFHLAIPVKDLASARRFYGELLGCPEGRSSDHWVDFNLFGHQLVCHKCEDNVSTLPPSFNPVDGDDVPIPHFGVVLEMPQWLQLRDRLVAAKVEFVVEPHIRFQGQPGEQATLFFYDDSGNALEFKSFKNIAEELFKK